nr:Ig-like domain-containing protein [Fictibacillus barbaricus]
MDEQWINVLRDTVAPGIPVVSQVNDQYDTVSGKAEPLSTIRIQLNSTTTKSVKVDGEGKYKLVIPGIKAGQNLDVKSQDRSGNLSKPKKMSVVDRTPPSMPKVNSIYKTSTKVTGTAENNASVFVVAGGKTYKGTALSGSYSITIPAQKQYAKVSVYATDAAGNKSSTAVVSVK